MGSARSDGTLKHSDSFTWYEELRNWDPMNFVTEWWSYSYNKVAVAGPRLVQIGMKVHKVANIDQGSRTPLLQRSFGTLTVGMVGETLFVLEGN